MSNRDDDHSKPLVFQKPLNFTQIADAVERSPDSGATIILSKLGISDVGSLEAEELAHANAGQRERQDGGSIVERLALGNNRLSTLPPEILLFTRLRYLNLKHNSFRIFPEVLTLIHSLDTLDLSHNRIHELPFQPGNLVRLRVLSLSRNKISRLPLYLTQFRNLEVLQIDRNPLDWPPRTVIESLGDVQDLFNGKDGIHSLYSWMEADGMKGRDHDDSGYGERPEWEDNLWRFPLREGHFDAIPTPHARSFSMESNISISSATESLHVIDGNAHNYTVNRQTGFSPNHTGRFSSRPSKISTYIASENSYISSPTIHEAQHDPEQMYSRAQSHTSTLRQSQDSFVDIKKNSLPDLRNANKDPEKKILELPEGRSPASLSPNPGQLSTDSSFFALNPQREDSISSSGSLHYPASMYADEMQSSDPGALPLVSDERNSYFQRSSTIIMSHSLPRSLLCLLESARTILFAMGQLYQTLEHYVHQGVDHRLSPAFKKALDPGNVNLLHLIRSLDRFDDVGRKSIPSPAVCRGLVESCRDTVATFRKGVGFLILQIDLDTTNDDARFVRWLILELYATTVELSFAWQAMVPEIESLKPFLYGTTFSSNNPFSFGGESDPLFFSSSPYSEDYGSVVRLRSAEPLHPTFGMVTVGRARTARRHAGSFSSKDVQIGKELPSYDILPSLAGGLATHTPTLRTPKRHLTTPIITTATSGLSSGPFNSSYFGPSTPQLGHHLRNPSRNSLPDSSPLMSTDTLLESPAINQMTINKEVLHAIQNAVNIAPTVWDQIEEVVDDIVHNDPEVRQNLESARSATRELSRHVFGMLEGDWETDMKILREDARLFLKVIVKMSDILKTRGNSHSVPEALRSNMVGLTNCTEEFAILLHISSLSSYTPSPSSPTSHFEFTTHNPAVEDIQLASSLSRTRSTQDIPNSALVTKKPPSLRRLRIVRESIDSNDPE